MPLEMLRLLYIQVFNMNHRSGGPKIGGLDSHLGNCKRVYVPYKYSLSPDVCLLLRGSQHMNENP